MIFTNILYGTLLFLSSSVIFDFKYSSNLINWRIVDDVVMGGRSDGNFEINESGNALFHGYVSLDNNGGFSSVRYRPGYLRIENETTIQIRLKGDGKDYQFRVKSDKNDWFSYIYTFQTSGEWETITIPLNQMEPGFRGRKVNMPNFQALQIQELAFLIGNKKYESFQLEIDKITLQ